MSANNRITVNLSADEYAALFDLSERFQVSLAWLGRRAISDMLEQSRNSLGQIDMPFLAPRDRRS